MTERTNARGRAADDEVSSSETDEGAVGGPAAVDAEQEIDELVAEIEQTRSEMTGTVEELGDRLDPGTIAERTTEKVRAATIGKVESKVDDMTNAASALATNASETVQETGSGVIETIRRNPVPAALAGFGIGWLVLNRQSGRTGSTARWSDSGSSGWTDDGRARNFADDRSGRDRRDASNMIEDVTGKAKRTAEDVASTVGETASEAATTVRSGATAAATTAQSAIESNALALGAIAVAVGAAVGLALPATQAEKRVMGQAGSELIDKAGSAVTRPLEALDSKSDR